MRGRSLTAVFIGALAVMLIAGYAAPRLLAVSASPVADAAMRGDVEGVRTLLRDGADVNAAQGDGMTALHWAALNGDLKTMNLLLYAGASTELADARRRLHAAAPRQLARPRRRRRAAARSRQQARSRHGHRRAGHCISRRRPATRTSVKALLDQRRRRQRARTARTAARRSSSRRHRAASRR